MFPDQNQESLPFGDCNIQSKEMTSEVDRLNKSWFAKVKVIFQGENLKGITGVLRA